MTSYKDKSDHVDASELNHDAYANGCVFYDKQEFAKAKVLFEEALEYWPEDPQAWFALGNCHDSMNQASRADICYLMSLKYSSEEAQPNVYFNLGNSLFDQGKYQKAIECYTKIDGQSKIYKAAARNLGLAKERLS